VSTLRSKPQITGVEDLLNILLFHTRPHMILNKHSESNAALSQRCQDTDAARFILQVIIHYQTL